MTTRAPSTLPAMLQRWWIAQLCRAGDRVIDVARGPSAQLPMLRHHPELHSLTILDLGPPNDTIDTAPFPVTRRHCDISRPWPVSGPFDVVIHVAPLGLMPTDLWLASLINAAEVLTLSGRLVLAVPDAVDAVDEILAAAGLRICVVHGTAAPEDPSAVDALLAARFGTGAAALHHALRRGCPTEVLGAVIATALDDDADEKLLVCQRWRPGSAIHV